MKLSYLQACIKEGLRRFPPITSLRERLTPPEGDILDGKFIPGGVHIGFNMRGLLSNPVFGEDTDVFRPERWLQCDTKRRQEMESALELVFGYGSTRCLGIRIASTTLNKFFVEVSMPWCAPWYPRSHFLY